MNAIILGDCLEKLKELADNSIDAVVTDPPYGIGFMGKEWDNFKPRTIEKIEERYSRNHPNPNLKGRRKQSINSECKVAGTYDLSLTGNHKFQEWFYRIAKECLRVLKPGAHLISFGGTRTYHRMACAIEDAGFEVRDMLEWIYYSGFPKSLNVGKAVDKLMGNEREVVGKKQGTYADIRRDENTGQDSLHGGTKAKERPRIEVMETKGNSPWEGYGTALKPAHEPIILARKPLSEKSIVENCLKWGTGALDIDGCRIGIGGAGRPSNDGKIGYSNSNKARTAKGSNEVNVLGRFPANVIVTNDALGKDESRYFSIDVWAEKHGLLQYPKASKSERNRGCEGMSFERHADRIKEDGVGGNNPRNRTNTPKQNHHPTVKPVHLMSWLVRLVSKEGDIVLDPFAGSGTTGVACKKLGRNFVGIELSEEYIKIAKKRINGVSTPLF